MSQVELKLKSGLPLCKKVILEEARVWLNRRDLSKAVVEIEVISKKRIKSLNKKFLGRDLATDVLSFPVGRIPGENQDELLLGTVFVCYDIIETQAKRAGVTTQAEVINLIRHGIDHLVGIHHK